MDWLKATDNALKSLAERTAEEIETTIDRAAELDAIWADARGEPGGTDIYKRLQRLEAMCEVPKVLAALGPQLLAVLRELGGTPEARGALKTDKPVGGRLAALRDAAGPKD